MSSINRFDKAMALKQPGKNRFTRTIGYSFDISNGHYIIFTLTGGTFKYFDEEEIWNVRSGVGQINRDDKLGLAYDGNPAGINIYDKGGQPVVLTTSTIPQNGSDDTYIKDTAIGNTLFALSFVNNRSQQADNLHGSCAFDFSGNLLWSFYDKNTFGGNNWTPLGMAVARNDYIYITGKNNTDTKDGIGLFELSPEGALTNDFTIDLGTAAAVDAGRGCVVGLNNNYLYFTGRPDEQSNLTIYQFDLDSFTVKDTINLSVSGIYSNCLVIDHKGNIYAGLDDGKIYKIAPDLSSSELITTAADAINGISVDSEGNIYYVFRPEPTDTKVVKIDSEANVIYSYTHGGSASGISVHPGPINLKPSPSAEPEPPSPPTGLSAVSMDKAISASVNPSKDTYVKGYRWYLDSNFIKETKKPNFIFENLNNYQAYNYTASVIDKFGNESDLASSKGTIPTPEGQFIATDDAYVYGSSPGNHNNTYLAFYANTSTSNFRSQVYIKFDFSSLELEQINSANLTLVYALDQNTSSFDINCFEAASENWSENTIDWNNKPGKTGAVLASANVPNDLQIGESIQFDITSFIEDHFNDKIASLYLEVANPSGYDFVKRFASKENSNYLGPILEIQ